MNPKSSPNSHSHQSEAEQFLLLVEQVQDYAIFMMDPHGMVATWNAGAERINGYKASEIIGHPYSTFFPLEDVAAGKPQEMLETAVREGKAEQEGWRVRKDGSRYWVSALLTATRDHSGKLLGFSKITRDITERMRYEENLRTEIAEKEKAQEDLVQSEHSLRLLVEQVQDYAIFMMDPQGMIATWNAGAERIKGYKASEIIGRPYATFFPPEDAAAGKPQQILSIAARKGKSEQEGWRVRKDGSRFWASALVTAIRDESGTLLGFSKVTRDVTERMRYEENLRAEIAEKEKAEENLVQSEDSLRQLSFRLLQAQDEERRRIGREMHDSIGQYLSALKIKLGLMLTKNPSIDQEGRRELGLCTTLLADCIKEVRTISYLLYPPMLEERGLKSAIDWYLDGFRKRSGITVNFESPERLERPSRDVELALFRVLQESVTNIHKHSGALVIDIALSAQNGTIDLKVRDYGKGLPQIGQGPKNDLSGVGLRGMTERMLQLGGTFKISSAHPGTLVHATVPAHGQSQPSYDHI